MQNAYQNLVKKNTCKFRNLAELIGLIVSSLPGMEYGPLHYHSLKANETNALTLSPNISHIIHSNISHIGNLFVISKQIPLPMDEEV